MVGRRPGLPKTGGRKPGVGNKSTEAMRKAIADAGGLEAAVRALTQLAASAKAENIRLRAAALLLEASGSRGNRAVSQMLVELMAKGGR